MMTTILAFAILTATTLLVLGNLRMVAHDTFEALSHAATRMRRSGNPGAKIAFVALWLLIFALSYL
ncbi:hypothetical protein M4578_09170 [Salipiger sp. P9]|uniref:hypothetical protein n=1 Tax=Salipiger pentaromativorans TaxID=2943193 RepID=UPI0021588B86|nr:hypothetical protein [Salipiger pentaromativorans]MCR8547997.1 hypothetical protein [Salipiger pentaromativorans]